MKMWIARTKEHGLYFTPVMPRYYENVDYWCYNKEYEDGTHMLNAGLQLDSKLYPEVTFENSPQEVELKIKNNGLHFSPMFRLLGMIINKDLSDRKRIVGYTKKLIDNLKEEGFNADARVAEDYLKAFNGEQVGMATMDEVELKLIEK